MVKRKNKAQIIEEELTDLIHSGKFSPHSQLPSLSKIAEKHGVSRNTVRLAFLNLEKRGLTEIVAGRGAFVSDYESRKRKLLRDNCIIVIFPNILGSMASEIERGIESVITEGNYFLTVFNSRDSFEREREVLKDALVLNPKGIIIFPIPSAYEHNPNVDIYVKVQKTGIPFIFIDNYPHYLDVDYVAANDFQGTYDLTSHMINRGHTKIAYFGRLDHISSLLHRYQGYKQAMIDAGLSLDWRLSFANEHTPVNPKMTFAPHFFQTVGARYLEHLMDSDLRPTGIVMDDLASSVTTKILCKYKIPGEISVASRRYAGQPEDVCLFFDAIYNRKSTSFLDLTHAEYSLPEIGKKAAEVLFDKLQGKSSSKRVRVELTMPIHIGNSVKRIKKSTSTKNKMKTTVKV